MSNTERLANIFITEANKAKLTLGAIEGVIQSIKDKYPNTYKECQLELVHERPSGGQNDLMPQSISPVLVITRRLSKKEILDRAINEAEAHLEHLKAQRKVF